MTKCVLRTLLVKSQEGAGTRTPPQAAHVLNVASLDRVPPHLGARDLQPWPTIFGMVLITWAKLWYVDRMAILYDDMVNASPELVVSRAGH